MPLFFDHFPTPLARQSAIADIWNDGALYGVRQDGAAVDLANVRRVDSIFEFSRDRLLQVHVNPAAAADSRLTDDWRERIPLALAAERFMIR